MNPPDSISERLAVADDLDIDSEPLPTPLAFEAGKGDEHKHTHGAIEAILESAGFRPDEIRAIYFGNWLRDYSQLLDPKIVRATTMSKSFPDLLSREALTRIVDVLAVKEFTDLMQIDRSRFVVTPQRLGVYRPDQHIDNPKAINPKPAHPKERDADFDDWVLPDDPALQVDHETSMKRYIRRSADIMTAGLESAIKAGPQSTDGLRDIGAALHILEDFFAHSNFVELSLIKLGHTHVLPWTSRADCKHQLPLVTGTFGGSDIIASLAEPLARILFSPDDKPFEAFKAGERYERDQIIQIILGEHPDQRLLESYEAFLEARDQWASQPFSEQVEQFYSMHLSERLGDCSAMLLVSLCKAWLCGWVTALMTCRPCLMKIPIPVARPTRHIRNWPRITRNTHCMRSPQTSPEKRCFRRARPFWANGKEKQMPSIRPMLPQGFSLTRWTATGKTAWFTSGPRPTPKRSSAQHSKASWTRPGLNCRAARRKICSVSARTAATF